MKICLLAHNNLFVKARGGEKSSRKIMKFLSELGHDCYVIQTKKNSDIESCCGVEIFNVDNVLLRSEQLVSVIKPDIILAWGRTISLAVKIKQTQNIPCINFVRTWNDTLRFPNIIENLKNSDSVIVNCEFGSKKLFKEYGIESKSSYPPIIVEPLKQHNPEYILSISKDKIKNIAIDLAPFFPEEKFLIIDFDKEPTTIDNITWINFQEDMSSIWEKTKITIDSSAHGSNFTLAGRMPIESQMYGIPCLNEIGSGSDKYCLHNVPNNAPLKKWKQGLNKILNNYEEECKKVKQFVYETYDKNTQLNVVQQEISRLLNKKKALVFLDAGVGNIIEKTHALNALHSMGYNIDVLLDSNSDVQEFVSAFNMVDSIQLFDQYNKQEPTGYDEYLSFNIQQKIHSKCICMEKDETIPERQWALNVVKKLGYGGPMPKPAKLIYSKTFFDVPEDSVVFSTGAVNSSWLQKQYPHYKELISYFKNPILVGSTNDLNTCEVKCTDYVGKLSLLKTTSLIQQCAAFVGHDSGLGHLASLLEKPTFIIYGPTSRIKNNPINGIILEKDEPIECEPCQYKGDKIFHCQDNQCLKQLLPSQVIAKMLQYIQLYNLPLMGIFNPDKLDRSTDQHCL